MTGTPSLKTKSLSLAGVALGIAIFSIGAVMASVVALVGLVLAAGSAIGFTWVSLGRDWAVRGVTTGLIGALVAWVAMRSMMRWVALSSGRNLTLTFEGTLAILLTSVALSMIPAMGYIHVRRRYGGSVKFGLGYGLILATVGGAPMVLLLMDEITSIARVPMIPVAFLLLVLVAYALTLEASHRMFRKTVG